MGELYKNIEELCKTKNVSITQMCKEANISRSILTDYKMGRTQKLSFETLSSIANYFNVTIDVISGTKLNFDFSQNDYDDYSQLIELHNKIFGAEYESLVHDFHNLSSDDKKKVCNLASDLNAINNIEITKQIADLFSKLPADKQEIIINTMKGFIK